MATKSVKKEPNLSSVVVDEKVINEAVAFINETANKSFIKLYYYQFTSFLCNHRVD